MRHKDADKHRESEARCASDIIRQAVGLEVMGQVPCELNKDRRDAGGQENSAKGAARAHAAEFIMSDFATRPASLFGCHDMSHYWS